MRVLGVLLFAWFGQSQPITVPAGTAVEARLESSVQSANSSQGDEVTAVLTQPIRAGRDTVVAEGSRLIGRVETIEPASRGSAGRVRLAFREMQLIDGRRVSTWITNSFSASHPKRNLKYVLFMGVGGAAGALIGGHSARVAGVLGGTLAGFVIAGNSEKEKFPEVKLKTGQRITLQFREDFRVVSK